MIMIPVVVELSSLFMTQVVFFYLKTHPFFLSASCLSLAEPPNGERDLCFDFGLQRKPYTNTLSVHKASLQESFQY